MYIHISYNAQYKKKALLVIANVDNIKEFYSMKVTDYFRKELNLLFFQLIQTNCVKNKNNKSNSTTNQLHLSYKEITEHYRKKNELVMCKFKSNDNKYPIEVQPTSVLPLQMIAQLSKLISQ